MTIPASETQAFREAVTAYTTAFFAALADAGLRHVCISPGSRSAPLALAAAAVQREAGSARLACSVHLDERAAGFFALGLAKARREPVALVCTSGTAAANYLPAVAEARYAGVPLVVLTADRPPELRDCGAGQTIDQRALYGSHVRWYAEVPVPGEDGPGAPHAAALARRAIECAWGGPAGPVHLNWPLREPLEPSRAPIEVTRTPSAGPQQQRRSRPGAEDVAALVALARDEPRGWVASGPSDDGPALAREIARFARAARWPVLTDPTAQLRRGEAARVRGAPLCAASDWLLRDADFAHAHAPDAVLRLGLTPISKAQRLALEAHPPARFVLLDPDAAHNDPSRLATERRVVDPAALLGAAADALEAAPLERRDEGWCEAWRAADLAAQRALARLVDDDPALLAGRAVRELGAALPDGSLLYAANSMAVRDIDGFLQAGPERLRVLCNRGANGIDGTVSSALGAARGWREGPVALLTGDLAFLHDLGGLLAAREGDIAATIVVLNDDGGGIFSYLPVAAHGEAVGFDALFRTPQGVDLARAAALVGARYTRASSCEHYRGALKDALASPGLSIVEVPIDRDANLAQHRAVASAVGAAW